MRVMFVTRWGVQCGIATYTDQLALALEKCDVKCDVAAERLIGIKEISVQSHASYTRCWDGRQPNYDVVYQHAKRTNPDVIHFQHEFGLMDSPKGFLELLPKLMALKVPVVFTCHTVMPPPSDKGWFFVDCMRSVSGIVAHNNATREALLRWRIPDGNIFVIPHGTPEDCEKKGKAESRRRLFLPEKPELVIAISLGFITEGKRQHEAVKAVIELVQEGLLDPRRFLYLIAGEPGQNYPANVEYCRKLYWDIEEARAWNYIRISPTFVPSEDLEYWYGAADFVITGSHETFFSVSGRSHQEMAYRMPSISSNARLLSDLDETRSLKYESEFQLRAHILTMIRDPGLRKALAWRCGNFADETSWTNVARKTETMYKALMERGR